MEGPFENKKLKNPCVVFVRVGLVWECKRRLFFFVVVFFPFYFLFYLFFLFFFFQKEVFFSPVVFCQWSTRANG